MQRKYIRNRMLSLILVFCLTVVMTCSGVQATNFTDTSSHWAASAIDRWSDYGILNGYEDGSFLPNQPITRAEMATIVDRIFCYQTGGGNVFADVSSDAWYVEAINHLAAAGVMLGDGINAYPRNNITRQEAVVMIARAFGIAASDAAIYYSDTDQIADWAIGLVRAMTENSYVRGDEKGAFNPTGYLTRAEAVTILNNMVGALYTTSKTPYAGSWTNSRNGYVIVSADEGITLKNMTVQGILMIMENVTGEVVLENVTVTGSIENRSGTVVTQKTVSFDGTFNYQGNRLNLFSNVPKNTLNSANFYKDSTGTMQYSGLETRNGIDVSEHQGTEIDWIQVKNSGVDFAMIRLGFRGYGSTGSLNLDSCFKRNLSGATAAGIKVGVYFFSQATSMQEAVEEAEFVLRNLQGCDISYPVVFDWEHYDSIPSSRTYYTDGQTVTNCAYAFCRRIADGGYIPMVYFNQQDGYLRYDLSVLADYAFWYAQYDAKPNFSYAFDIWQYTESGSVPGIPGAVDRNIQFVF